MSAGFVPHHRLIVPEGEPSGPRRWVLFLHGIYGAGDNWSRFAHELVASHPGWGAVLVDLRQHGRSQGAPSPHHLAACAADLVRLAAGLDGPVGAVSGHSFGGKVALAYTALEAAPLERVWLLDSDPAPRPGRILEERSDASSALGMLAILERLPDELPSRESFTEALRSRGVSEGVAAWMAKNLRREDDRFRLILDVAAMRELLEDYLRADLWPVLETPPAGTAIHVVLGGRSDAVSSDTRRRFAEGAPSSPWNLHTIPEAGHWLHVDAPRELAQIFANSWPSR